MVRFLRWDRSGTFIMRAFYIRQEPGLLVDFLRLYYHLSKGACGLLTIVSWAREDKSRDNPKKRKINRRRGINSCELLATSAGIPEQLVSGHDKCRSCCMLYSMIYRRCEIYHINEEQLWMFVNHIPRIAQLSYIGPWIIMSLGE
jgi:hypothetical protein